MLDQQRKPLEAVLDRATKAGKGAKLSIGDVMDRFGTQSFGPVITVLALIVISPIGAIPTMPTLFGTVIFLISVQLLFGRKHPWIPKRLRDICFERKKAEHFRDKAQKPLGWLDRLFRKRLAWLTGGAGQWIAALCICLLAACFPPLEVVPGGVYVPALGVLFLAIGLTACDGLLLLLGFAWVGASAYIVIRFLIL